MSLLDHLLVVNDIFHGPREQSLWAPSMESLMRTSLSTWLDVGIHFETDLTQLQLCCLEATPLVQDFTQASTDPLRAPVGLGVKCTAEGMLDPHLVKLLAEGVTEGGSSVRPDTIGEAIAVEEHLERLYG